MADLHVMGPRLYSCCNCRNHVALHDDVISKAFQGRNGRAFLFSHAMNVVIGAREDRQLMTGLHTVADVYCSDCHEVIGWKYERAYERTQKYKEGKFILEKSKIVQENWCNSIVDMFFILYSKRDRRLDYHGNFLMLKNTARDRILCNHYQLYSEVVYSLHSVAYQIFDPLILPAMEHLRMLDEYTAPRELRGEVF